MYSVFGISHGKLTFNVAAFPLQGGFDDMLRESEPAAGLC